MSGPGDLILTVLGHKFDYDNGEAVRGFKQTGRSARIRCLPHPVNFNREVLRMGVAFLIPAPYALSLHACNVE